MNAASFISHMKADEFDSRSSSEPETVNESENKIFGMTVTHSAEDLVDRPECGKSGRDEAPFGTMRMKLIG